MQRICLLSLSALLALAAPGWAGLPCLGCPGPNCLPIPCPTCPDCSCPCDHRLHLTPFGSRHAQGFIEHLGCGDCCERIKAAQKLGSRLHADFCDDPAVLGALIAALHCDPCWEVRRAAAWSIAMQGARTHDGVLALYVQSKIDPHYLVRTRAAEALDILTVCRAECFTDVYTEGDSLVKALKAAKYAPGPDCPALFGGCAAPIPVAPPPGPAKVGQAPTTSPIERPLPAGQ
jgi:hypothetical protein